ncbi:MAG: hypothetical protein CSA81_07325 [Acidobacteria bacterium]|nr:MAG: hypothetical protein CSA81_07325 [Acidobacteriota bacterium]
MLEQFNQYIFSEYGLLVTWLLGVLIGALLIHRLNKALSSFRGKKRQKQGIKAQKKAARLLKKNGFKIIESEPRIQSRLMIDGQIVTFEITPDFMVERDGMKYTVEVKSQSDKNLIHQADVRRQLIEYIKASHVPCILLTMQDQFMTEVEWPEFEE